MSFSLHAKRARNSEEVFGRRVSSVRSCTERYQPLGFHATLAFVESQVGPLRRDEATLLAGLELLEASRQSWRREKETFAVVRSLAKEAGRRSLRKDERNVEACDRWHADPYAGALFAVEYWQRVHRLDLGMADDPDPAVELADAVAEACLNGEALRDPLFASRLRTVRGEMRGRWEDHPVTHYRRQKMVRMLHDASIVAEYGQAEARRGPDGEVGPTSG